MLQNTNDFNDLLYYLLGKYFLQLYVDIKYRKIDKTHKLLFTNK